MIAQAEQAIYEALSGAEGLSGGVYCGLAPEGAARPYAVFRLASTEAYACGANIIGNNYLYAVESYADGESFPHDQAAVIETALSGYDEMIGELRISITNIRDLAIADQLNGREIRRSGGIYRVIVR